jgi:hypothetical protein
VFQQLSTANRTLGYMLFEHTHGLGVLPEILRLDLSRTLEAIFSSEELADYSQTLELEIATRRGVEAELRRSNANVQKSLMIDGLTGIPNRAAFERYSSTADRRPGRINSWPCCRTATSARPI